MALHITCRPASWAAPPSAAVTLDVAALCHGLIELLDVLQAIAYLRTEPGASLQREALAEVQDYLLRLLVPWRALLRGQQHKAEGGRGRRRDDAEEDASDDDGDGDSTTVSGASCGEEGEEEEEAASTLSHSSSGAGSVVSGAAAGRRPTQSPPVAMAGVNRVAMTPLTCATLRRLRWLGLLQLLRTVPNAGPLLPSERLGLLEGAAAVGESLRYAQRARAALVDLEDPLVPGAASPSPSQPAALSPALQGLERAVAALVHLLREAGEEGRGWEVFVDEADAEEQGDQGAVGE